MAYVVNHLLRENGKSIADFLMVKTFQKCNPQDLKFYLCKLDNKNFLVFTALNNTKKQRKFNITPYWGKFLLFNLLGYNLKSDGYIFEKFFLPLKSFGMDPVFAQ